MVRLGLYIGPVGPIYGWTRLCTLYPRFIQLDLQIDLSMHVESKTFRMIQQNRYLIQLVLLLDSVSS